MANKKIGRPTNAPKNKTIKFRIDDETDKKLRYCSDELNISKSEVLRKGVHKVYDDLDKQ
ncbi:CopG family transcriptional regulator [Maledivibacter halophilus]|uniref:Ribbon-helix-helix protein, copG family n=1 Tax=Maledivibacter halophilus TaxID=36842 RepID=A0A1T5LLL8_9FIRM|nr:CopG family transcriptional regulator [Maledivibacter halophilus]SKC76705.1 hypothetical protein SAMN02194393_03025 [Maledivibacter halophilus]